MSAIDRWWESDYPDDLNKDNKVKTVTYKMID
jgi:hypothetical protein